MLKTQILSSPKPHTNFDETVKLHKDFIVQIGSMEPTHNVSKVKTHGDRNKGEHKKPRQQKDNQTLDNL